MSTWQRFRRSDPLKSLDVIYVTQPLLISIHKVIRRLQPSATKINNAFREQIIGWIVAGGRGAGY